MESSIYKFLAVLKQKKILGIICFSEQIFYRKQSLGAPVLFMYTDLERYLVLLLPVHFWDLKYICRLVLPIFIYSWRRENKVKINRESSVDAQL